MKRMRLIPIDLVLLGVAILAFCGGCKRPVPQAKVPSTETARANTLAYLAEKLKRQQAGTLDPFYLDYHVPMWKRAMDKLQATAATGPIDPMPVLAILSLPADRPSALSLLWLEPGFDVRGVQLVDESGELARLQDGMAEPPRSPEDQRSLQSTLVRTHTLSVGVGDEGSAVGPGSSGMLHLPLARAPKGRTKLILLYGSGKQAEPHEVLVQTGEGERSEFHALSRPSG